MSSLSYRINPQAITLLDDWHNDIFNLVEKNKVVCVEYLTKISFLCWEIWRARCNFIYSSSSLEPIKTALFADSAAFEYLQVINKPDGNQSNTSHNSQNNSTISIPSNQAIISSDNPSSSHWSSHAPISNIHVPFLHFFSSRDSNQKSITHSLIPLLESTSRGLYKN